MTLYVLNIRSIQHRYRVVLGIVGDVIPVSGEIYVSPYYIKDELTAEWKWVTTQHMRIERTFNGRVFSPDEIDLSTLTDLAQRIEVFMEGINTAQNTVMRHLSQVRLLMQTLEVGVIENILDEHAHFLEDVKTANDRFEMVTKITNPTAEI